MYWRRLKLSIIAGTAILLCLVAAMAVQLLQRGETATLQTARTSIERSARAVENSLNRQLLQVHGALASLPTLFSATDASDPEVAGKLLRGLNFQTLAYRDLLLVDANGTVIPTARAAQLTMNREGIRRLAAEELGLPTSPYYFADTYEDYAAGVAAVGYPCVVKPIMSSSGKGQSVLKSAADLKTAWDYAQEGGRAGKGRVIVEGFIDFDYEITLLTVRHIGGTTFCAPIGHRQVKGDYHESWQPQAMSPKALAESERVARAVTEALGGRGLFGVELFVKGDEVWFSEVSPRPHDTGLVTLISQDLSEFALHARAILGLPIPVIRQLGDSASAVILVEGKSQQVSFGNLGAALSEPDTALRLFGKPEVDGQRRMGVALARDESIDAARAKATRSAQAVNVEL